MLDFKKGLRSFYLRPFESIDGLNLSFFIWSWKFDLNVFRNFRKLRSSVLAVASVSLVGWILFGFDSTPLQFIHALSEVPAWILGSGSFQDVVNAYVSTYGKEMHYSAFLIYGLSFYFLSRHFEKEMSWTGSKNVAYASAITLFSVSIFEFFWMLSFAHFQGQSWVITFAWPQARILLQNSAFFVAGLLVILYMYVEAFEIDENKDITARNYFFNFNLVQVLLIVASVISALFWIYYPGSVTPVQVTLETGQIWTSSRLFPQTLYTVDLNPLDSENAGSWFWIEDNLIHGVNTIVKAIWTLTTINMFKVKRN